MLYSGRTRRLIMLGGYAHFVIGVGQFANRGIRNAISYPSSADSPTTSAVSYGGWYFIGIDHVVAFGCLFR